jgi:hypothetical protein
LGGKKLGKFWENFCPLLTNKYFIKIDFWSVQVAKPQKNVLKKEFYKFLHFWQFGIISKISLTITKFTSLCFKNASTPNGPLPVSLAVSYLFNTQKNEASFHANVCVHVFVSRECVPFYFNGLNHSHNRFDEDERTSDPQ